MGFKMVAHKSICHPFLFGDISQFLVNCMVSIISASFFKEPNPNDCSFGRLDIERFLAEQNALAKL